MNPSSSIPLFTLSMVIFYSSTRTLSQEQKNCSTLNDVAMCVSNAYCSHTDNHIEVEKRAKIIIKKIIIIMRYPEQ